MSQEPSGQTPQYTKKDACLGFLILICLIVIVFGGGAFVVSILLNFIVTGVLVGPKWAINFLTVIAQTQWVVGLTTLLGIISFVILLNDKRKQRKEQGAKTRGEATIDARTNK